MPENHRLSCRTTGRESSGSSEGDSACSRFKEDDAELSEFSLSVMHADFQALFVSSRLTFVET